MGASPRDGGGPFAHSMNRQGERQGLSDHLRAVADSAATFASAFGAAGLGQAAGSWHDLGKYHPRWQQYLLDAEAGSRRGGPDHKGAGTLLAADRCELLAFLIAGHHGGLMDASELLQRIDAWRGNGEAAEALRRVPAEAGDGVPAPILPAYLD